MIIEDTIKKLFAADGDWRPGQRLVLRPEGSKSIREELIDQMRGFGNDREDAIPTERHADPFSSDCPAMDLMRPALDLI